VLPFRESGGKSAVVRKGALWTAVVLVSTFALFVALPRAKAGPFEGFFRSLKHFFARPEHRTSPHHAHHQHTAKKPEPNATATRTTSARPAERNTRPVPKALRAKAGKGDDFPYGIPVPGKRGFVTSPFAPDSGYIDVRAFQPGTPVKDPYTGKIFLTP
jgi:hypothetical protein